MTILIWLSWIDNYDWSTIEMTPMTFEEWPMNEGILKNEEWMLAMVKGSERDPRLLIWQTVHYKWNSVRMKEGERKQTPVLVLY